MSWGPGAPRCRGGGGAGVPGLRPPRTRWAPRRGGSPAAAFSPPLRGLRLASVAQPGSTPRAGDAARGPPALPGGGLFGARFSEAGRGRSVTRAVSAPEVCASRGGNEAFIETSGGRDDHRA